jgi:hypothetical protein
VLYSGAGIIRIGAITKIPMVRFRIGAAAKKFYLEVCPNCVILVIRKAGYRGIHAACQASEAKTDKK